MNKHSELEHPRAATGIWTEKVQTAPELPSFAPDIVERMRNFDHTNESETALWHYNAAGELHRTNGPAIERDGDDNHYFVNGAEIFAPDNTGFDLQHVLADGTQHWSSGTGNRTVDVSPDGRSVFIRDGDAHRSGGPAIVNADGTGRWFSYGHEIDSPWPEDPTITHDETADTVTITGAKFRDGASMTFTQIDLKKDIANAIRAGILDDLGVQYKLTIQRNRREDRPTLSVEVKGLVGERAIRAGDDGDQPFLSDEAIQIRDALERLGQAYNRTTTHNGTDSIQSPFWFNVTIATR